METSTKYKKSKFQQMYFMFYFTLAVFGGFIVPYIESLNVSKTAIGFILAGMSFTGVLGQFVWGYLCDSIKAIKKVYVFCMVLLSAGITLLVYITNVDYKIYILIGLGFFYYPLMALLDSWTIESSTYIRNQYGAIRALGSLGWALSAVALGRVFERYGWKVMPVIFIIFMFGLLWSLHSIPDGKHEVAGDDEHKVSLKSVKALLTDMRYFSLTSIFVVLFISHFAAFTFSMVLITDLGGGQGDIGLFLFVIAISEIPVFFMMNPLMSRFKPSKLLILTAFFIAIRGFSIRFAGDVNTIILLAVLQMVTFSPFISLSKQLVDEICPEELKTTSQMVAMASYFGIAGILSFILSGIIAEKFGIIMVMNFAGSVGLIGFVATIIYHLRYYKDVEKSVEMCRPKELRPLKKFADK